MRTCPLAFSASGCLGGRFVGMEGGGVVLPILAVVRVARAIVVHGALMMAERHALPGAHRRRALKGHDNREKRNQEQPGELHRHAQILPQNAITTSRLAGGSVPIDQSRGVPSRSIMAKTARI